MRNKIALVTGGNRGIGLAIVKGLAQQGHTVLLGCRDVQVGEQAAETVNGDVHVVKLDLSTHEARQIDSERISNQYPNIDILVNNAGIYDLTRYEGVDYATLMRSMETNALAAHDLIQHFGTKMQHQGYGRIVNVSSGGGAFSDGLTSPVAYAISKATLNAITLVASQNFHGNIKINAMCPGWVRTAMGGAGAPRSPEQGAETAIWLANLDDNAPTGGFFRDKKAIAW